MKIAMSLFSFAFIAFLNLPSWALRGVKEGGGDDAVVLRCHALTKAKVDIVGLSYDDSDLVELRIFVNEKLKTTDYGIWDSSSISYIGYHFDLGLPEKKLTIKTENTALGKAAFLDLTCDRTPL